MLMVALIKPPFIVIAWEFGCLCVPHFSVLVRHHKTPVKIQKYILFAYFNSVCCEGEGPGWSHHRGPLLTSPEPEPGLGADTW